MRRRAGFTLVELMVATVIFLIILGAVYGMYAAANRAMNLAADHQDVYQTGRVLLAQLTEEVTCAYQASTAVTSTLTGTDATDPDTGLPTDTLTLLTTAHPAPAGQPAGDISQETYTIGDGTSDHTTGLYVAEDFYPGLETPDFTATPRLISPLVTGLYCQYLTTDGTWQTDWTDQTTLPVAVHVELTLQPRTAGAQPIVLGTTANLPMATTPPPATGGS